MTHRSRAHRRHPSKRTSRLAYVLAAAVLLALALPGPAGASFKVLDAVLAALGANPAVILIVAASALFVYAARARRPGSAARRARRSGSASRRGRRTPRSTR